MTAIIKTHLCLISKNPTHRRTRSSWPPPPPSHLSLIFFFPFLRISDLSQKWPPQLEPPSPRSLFPAVSSTDRKTMPVEEILTINIKPGWKKGTKITFPEKGNELPNVTPADLVFIIDEKPHSVNE